MTGRWWRRNWWGVLAAVPVLAALVLLSPEESYQTWWSAQPRDAISPGADGWARYGGGRVRLAELAPAELQGAPGEPYSLPAGLRAWQATVVIEAPPDPTQLWGCELQLEDEQGRLFGNDPTELADARLSDGEGFIPYRCQDPDEGGAPQFENVALFVLPESANPVALRVSTELELPVYIRFELG